MSEAEPSAVHTTGDFTEARIALEFPHGIEAIIDIGWGSSTERRSVTLVGSNASLKFDLDIHDKAELISGGEQKTILCHPNHTPLEAELRHILSGVESHKSGNSWTAIPDYGAALRGVRWTERAIRALPVPRPH